MKLKLVFEKINFSERYRMLCERHNNFHERLRGNKRSVYESVLKSIGVESKYYSNGSFYQVLNEADEFEFMLNLVLKNGIVESLIYIKEKGVTLGDLGRFDFLPEKFGIPFDRKRFNLPSYCSEAELEEILKEIFSIYEDIKREVINSQV